jgi:mannitol 2-dehydrogenase
VTTLSTAALASLGVPVPRYDRSAVTPGIVHLGVGGFHRAHQAVYVDDLLDGGATEWGICGVGVLPGDVRMRDALAAQDHLFTVVVKHPDGTLEPRVVGSIVEFLFAPDDPEAVLERLAAPTTRVVSLTITEGGYAVPSAAFEYLLQALARRRSRGLPPFAVMSCDNIRGNGHVARTALTSFAHATDPDLAAWIAAEVAFPSSMVDRITPVTTEQDRTALSAHFGIEDAWPVVCEPWTQWVLEDHLGRPDWESVGVQVVDDVEPYELMKLRLLNCSHQALAYLGYLAGHRFAHEACAEPLFRDFLLAYMAQTLPTLKPVPGVDLDGYRHALVDRFANPAVADTLARLCADTSDRIPNWMVPVALELLEQGRPVDLLALVVASWRRYAQGVDEQGHPIDVIDQRRDAVMGAARSPDPLDLLRLRDLFGDLVADAGFTTPYLAAVASLDQHGARQTLLNGSAARAAEAR